MSGLHQVVCQSDSDCVTVIGAGITLHEALGAADILKSEGKLMSPSCGQMFHSTFLMLSNTDKILSRISAALLHRSIRVFFSMNSNREEHPCH